MLGTCLTSVNNHEIERNPPEIDRINNIKISTGIMMEIGSNLRTCFSLKTQKRTV